MSVLPNLVEIWRYNLNSLGSTLQKVIIMSHFSSIANTHGTDNTFVEHHDFLSKMGHTIPSSMHIFKNCKYPYISELPLLPSPHHALVLVWIKCLSIYLYSSTTIVLPLFYLQLLPFIYTYIWHSKHSLWSLVQTEFF